ncbi:TetR/AcrR family transcriptional regulator [Nitriliruptor alkaliphilus]|uniref:TetR/AcrR family transcriptional regulator n=1 Tax=Nitriliruptor alkaliphilus TaxID=427918 RepID=UPI000695BA30|nr:TetR/AcrR family transcriptional regulator [Nitriliruptor alkaliphilus]
MARPRVYGESTRRELIDAAGALLAERGPAALSVRAVAEAVGATTSAIYALFGSKAELVRGMYVAGFAALDDHLAAVPVTDDPWRDVLELGLAYRASALAEPHLYRVMFDRPVVEFVPDADDAALALGTLAHLERATARIEATLGLPRGLDLATATRALWARAHGLATLELAGGLGDGGEALWRAVLLADQHGWRSRGASDPVSPRG